MECLADFLGSLLTLSINSAEASLYFQSLARPADLPTSPIPTTLTVLFRQNGELSLLRHLIALMGSTRILTGWPSTSPFGFALGPDLPAVD